MRLNEYQTVCMISIAVVFLYASTLHGQITTVAGYPAFQCQGQHMSFSSAQNGIFAGFQRRYKTFATKDSCASWTFFNVDSLKSGVGKLNAITVDSTGYGWCVGEDVAMVTTDYGTSWKQIGYKSADTIANELSRVVSTDVCTVGDSLVWIAGEMAHLLFSSDRGSTWSRIPCYVPEEGVALSVQFVTRTHGWVLFKKSRKLFETTDGGVNWRKIVDSRAFSDVQMVNDSLGWAASGREILRTTDGGRSWTRTFRDPVVNSLVLTHYGEHRVWCAPLDLVSVGLGDRVHASFDDGKTWDTLRGPKASGYREIFAADSNTVYASFDYALYRINYDRAVDTTTAINDVSDGARSINVHFDGVAERLRISGFEPIRRIMVFNVVGDIVADAEVTDGTLATELQTDTIPNGMYYLRYRIGERWYTTGTVLTR